MYRIAVVTLAVAAALAASVCARADDGASVTVMTRNLYFGADLGPVIAAPTPLAFVQGVATAYGQAVASDWNGRAKRWAREIADAKPDLVGLQEAVQWQTQLPGAAPIVVADFETLLLDELERLGLRYVEAAKDTGYDVSAPGLFSFGSMNVRLTQHDVILARVEPRLTVSNNHSGTYAAQVAIPTAVGVIPLPWAWASVDATIDGRTFRFATTHLDSNFGAAQVAQAQEFLAGAGATSLPLIWAGDFNSDANATTITGAPPNTTTYRNLVAAGLADAWAAANPGDPGYTCCQAADLANPRSTLDERIDLVFTRGPWKAVKARLVGEAPADKTSGGLWPSDHAGVVAKLNLRDSSEVSGGER